MLTIKSDDVYGRAKAYESIVKGEHIKKPRTPESFSVLVKELQSLGLSVNLLKLKQDDVIEEDEYIEAEDLPGDETPLEHDIHEVQKHEMPDNVVAKGDIADGFETEEMEAAEAEEEEEMDTAH